jgi:hypothetical protein
MDPSLLEAIDALGATVSPREPGLIWARLAGADPAIYVDFAISRAAITVDLVEADDQLRSAVAPFLAWIVDEFEASAHDHHGVNVTALILRNGSRVSLISDASESAGPNAAPRTRIARSGSRN